MMYYPRILMKFLQVKNNDESEETRDDIEEEQEKSDISDEEIIGNEEDGNISDSSDSYTFVTDINGNRNILSTDKITKNKHNKFIMNDFMKNEISDTIKMFTEADSLNLLNELVFSDESSDSEEY